MKRACVVSLLLGLALPFGATASVVHVDRDAPGGAHDGLSWATAFLTVKDGLSAAASADEVWVAQGAYAENATIAAGVALFGGFAGTETERSQRDIRANPTVLDGGTSSLDTVTCKASNVVVDGFSIRGGRYGVFVSGGNATVRNSAISGASFAGVAIASSTADVIGNAIFGGVKYGVYISFGTATLTGNTIASNAGDGVYAFFSDTLRMTNNSVAFNTGRGVRNASTAIPVFSHNDVYDNKGGDYSGFTPPAGAGNLSLDPLFTDKAGDFHLKPGSPCIDAGDDSVMVTGSTDLDGKPRIQGAHVDIGAYEYEATGPAPFTLSDVTRSLSIACGLIEGTADDLARLNVEAGSAGLDMRDALRLARKVAGLEPNP